MYSIKEITALAGLNSTPSVRVMEDDYTTKREALAVLAGAGLLDPEDERALDLRHLSDEARDHALQQMAVIDTLGEYFSTDPKIVIYNKMCRLAAKTLDVDWHLVKQVVLVHEICHLITHRAEDAKGGIWQYFEYASSNDKEFFAQIYTLRHFQHQGDERCEGVFRKLAKHQSERYNSWRESEHAQMVDINRDLLVARRRPLLNFGRSYSRSQLHYDGIWIDRRSYGWPVVDGTTLRVSRSGAVDVIQRDWLNLPGLSDVSSTPVSVPPRLLLDLESALDAAELAQKPSTVLGPLCFLGGCSLGIALKDDRREGAFLVNCNLSGKEWLSDVMKRVERVCIAAGLCSELEIVGHSTMAPEHALMFWFGDDIELADAFGLDLERGVVLADQQHLNGAEISYKSARVRLQRLRPESRRRDQLQGSPLRESYPCGHWPFLQDIICERGREFGDRLLAKLRASGIDGTSQIEALQCTYACEGRRGVRAVDLPGMSAWRNFLDTASWIHTIRRFGESRDNDLLRNEDDGTVHSWVLTVTEVDYLARPLHIQFLAKLMCDCALGREIEVDQEVHANTNNVPFLGKKYTLDGFCKEAVDNYSSWSDAGEHLYYCLADRFETLLQRDLEKWTPRSRLS